MVGSLWGCRGFPLALPWYQRDPGFSLPPLGLWQSSSGGISHVRRELKRNPSHWGPSAADLGDTHAAAAVSRGAQPSASPSWLLLDQYHVSFLSSSLENAVQVCVYPLSHGSGCYHTVLLHGTTNLALSQPATELPGVSLAVLTVWPFHLKSIPYYVVFAFFFFFFFF